MSDKILLNPLWDFSFEDGIRTKLSVPGWYGGIHTFFEKSIKKNKLC